MNSPTVITPYIFRNEVEQLINSFGMDIPYIIQEDVGRIGSDLMYQKLWKEANSDIIIIHADMLPLPNDKNNQWYRDLCMYSERYPEAGMLGCKLLYPAVGDNNKLLIQSAGGRFVNDNPDHFGSGFDVFSGKIFKQIEEDIGQYDCVREVAWTTFGGVLIRKEVLEQVGDFDTTFEQQYNRDVDYCLQARKLGWKIYQTPVTLIHFESKDNKRVRTQQHYEAEHRNLIRLKEKWLGTPLYQTIDRIII